MKLLVICLISLFNAFPNEKYQTLSPTPSNGNNGEKAAVETGNAKVGNNNEKAAAELSNTKGDSKSKPVETGNASNSQAEDDGSGDM